MKYHLFLTLICLIIAVVMYSGPATASCAQPALMLAAVAAILATRESRNITVLSFAFPVIGLMTIFGAHNSPFVLLQILAGMTIAFVAVLQAISAPGMRRAS